MNKTFITFFTALVLATSAVSFAHEHGGHRGHGHCSEECMKNCKEKHNDCKDGECPMERKAKKGKATEEKKN